MKTHPVGTAKGFLQLWERVLFVHTVSAHGCTLACGCTVGFSSPLLAGSQEAFQPGSPVRGRARRRHDQHGLHALAHDSPGDQTQPVRKGALGAGQLWERVLFVDTVSKGKAVVAPQSWRLDPSGEEGVPQQKVICGKDYCFVDTVLEAVAAEFL